MFILGLLTFIFHPFSDNFASRLINGYTIAQAQNLKASQFLFFPSNLSETIYQILSTLNSEILEFIDFSLPTLPPFCFLDSYQLPPNKTSHDNQNSYLKQI